jgi:predicted HTH domain antitoxin
MGREVIGMPLTISDHVLREAKMTEREMLIEIACRLFDADRLNKPEAMRLAGLTRTEFEGELLKRGLPLIHLDEEYVGHEVESAQQFGRDRSAE